MTTTTNDLQTFLSNKIYHWVHENFGKQEADEPSWSIAELSKYLAKELGERERAVSGTKPYELTIVTRINADVEKEVRMVARTIKRAGGEVISTEVEGKKKLAYSINGEDYAVYTCMYLELPNDAPTKISEKLGRMDSVLRYLMVRTDSNRR